ncbi:hypothetical protein [Pseudomonas sp. URMO17WK12:I12]|jgi:hypothetical protein|uniref:hypothetical protein n=1 Tax=Pseudomonas sp. URMO17WK12:I12 TaxID=1259797 RepID=UPI00047F4737|nr:hypothetical protein [Pseudomonas sp. URMO17WK12:I12]
MDTPSTSQGLDEEFNATIKFASGNFAFKANKISIKESVDSLGNKCWRVQAFQDIYKDFPPKPGLAGIKEVIAIHLYIGEELSGTNEALVPAIQPPNAIKNSGNLFKIVDKKPDKDDVIDTAETYPGTEGIASYEWNQERTRIKGTFRLLVMDCDNPGPETDINIYGNFNLLNSGDHRI